jgi:hypothetical protein
MSDLILIDFLTLIISPLMTLKFQLKKHSSITKIQLSRHSYSLNIQRTDQLINYSIHRTKH